MITGIIKGMILTIKTAFFSKNVTLQYPSERRDLPYRGLHELNKETCITCNLCAVECPVDAISIKLKSRHEKTRKIEDYDYQVDIGKCIWCGICEDVCPKKSVKLSSKYEMSDYDKKNLVVINK